jgi:hypothetical protein
MKGEDQFQPHVRNFLIVSVAPAACLRSRGPQNGDLLSSGHIMKIGRTLHWNAEKEEIEGDAEAAKLRPKSYRAPGSGIEIRCSSTLGRTR